MDISRTAARLFYGVLWLVAATAGAVLGHAGWHDLPRLAEHLARSLARLAATGLVGVFAGACLAGLAAGASALLALAVGRLVRALWLTGPPGPPARLLIRRRQKRWDAAATAAVAARERRDHAALARAAARRNRICLDRPTAPTWAGDEIVARETRIRCEYGLDLHAAWPHLLVLAPASARADSERALTGWERAGETGAWGVLFVLLAPWWWPAALVGGVVWTLGLRSARASWGAYTALTEAIVDLYGPRLAAALRIEVGDWPDAHVGRETTDRLRKGT